jgi:hypothetical protein
MDRDDEFRKRAAEARAMAERTVSVADRTSWLRLAEGWLSLIGKPKPTEPERFDDNATARGSGQDNPESSH